jgi:hypothetical protein
VKKFKKAEIEIVYFECKDIITTSHDNGFIGSDELAYLIQDLKKLIPDSILK